MGKWFGAIGYAEVVETTPGVWVEQITERQYYGEVHRNTRRLQSSDLVNDDINISNEISIVADPFAYQNFHSIRYVEFMGAKWKVNNIEVRQPRLVLTVGGLYNGQQTNSARDLL